MSEMIDQKTKDKIIGILTVLFPEAKIYLFGSRATGKARPFSDIDIALDAGKKLELSRIGEARDMFNQSNIPFGFDFVDLQCVHPDFRATVLKEGILWKS
jgi:predicted nucleotidyltransferase